MKLLQNTKFTGPALILLLCLNTTLMVMLLLKHPPKPPGFPPHLPMEQGPGPGAGPHDFLVHELNMSADQLAKYDSLIKIHRAAVEKIQDDIRLQRDAMIDELGKTSVDSNQLETLAGKIGADQAQLERATFEHFRNLKEICTPDQQVKFDSVIHEALRMMGPPHPPGNPPPPRAK